MHARDRIYINGQWVEASGGGVIEVIDPATEQCIGSVPVGSAADVDAAVAAAKAAFPSWSGLLYTSDAADDMPCVDLGGRRFSTHKHPHIT